MGGPFGAFGKIPALGDFLRLNVASGFVQTWDDWMQASMLDTSDALQEDWDNAYMSAPIWRFTLPGGCAGDAGVIGIFMASVDRVGRKYPLTLAAPLDTGNVALCHFANTGVFEQLEQIALAMLDDGSTRDALTNALEPVAPLPPITPEQVAYPYVGHLPLEHVLAGQSLSTHVDAQTAVWSTAMDQDHRLMLTRGLPKGRESRALFDLSPHLWSNQDMAALI
jgi:type VI secretion system protein ImpM